MAIYCVDPISGNNANPGTPASPWLNFANIQTTTGAGTQLFAGDEVRVLGDSLYTTIATDVYFNDLTLVGGTNTAYRDLKQWLLLSPTATDWPTYFGSNNAFIRDPATGWFGLTALPLVGGTAATMWSRAITGNKPYSFYNSTTEFTTSNPGQLDGFLPVGANPTWTNLNWSGVASSSYLNMSVTTAGYSQVVISGGWNATFDGPMTGDWATSFSTITDSGKYNLAGGGSLTAPTTSRYFINNQVSNTTLLNAQFGLELKNFNFHGCTGMSRQTGGWYKETNCSYIDAFYGVDPGTSLSLTGLYFRYYWRQGGFISTYGNPNPWLATSSTPVSSVGFYGSGLTVAGPAMTTNISWDTPSLESTHTFWTYENVNMMISGSSASSVTSFPTQGSGRGVTVCKGCNIYASGGTDQFVDAPNASTLLGWNQPAYLGGFSGQIGLKSPFISLAPKSFKTGFGLGESLAPIYLTDGYAPFGINVSAMNTAENNNTIIVTDTSTYTYLSIWDGIDQVDPLKTGQAGYTPSVGNNNQMPSANFNATSPIMYGGSWGRVFFQSETADVVYGTGYPDSDRIQIGSFNNSVALTHIHNGKTYKYLANGLVTGISDTIYETGTNSMVFKNTNYSNASGSVCQYAKVWQGAPTTNVSTLTVTIRFNKYYPFGIAPGEWIDAYAFQDGEYIAKSTRSTTTMWPTWYPGPNATGWTTLTISIPAGDYRAGSPIKIYVGGDLWVDPLYVAQGVSGWTQYFTLEGSSGFQINTIYVDRVEVTPDVF